MSSFARENAIVDARSPNFESGGLSIDPATTSCETENTLDSIFTTACLTVSQGLVEVFVTDVSPSYSRESSVYVHK